MFIPGGCFCCEPPEDPCVLSGCTWSSTDMSDTDLTAGTAYYNPVSGTTPDGSYEITNAQETGTGNDAPCRKITIETIEAPQKPDTIYAICWKDNATHNPATQCPLTSVSFCVESKRHGDSDSGLTDSVVFVVRQNNRIFATAAQSVGVNWKRASGTYTQGSFTEIDGAGNPDFTATGTSIEFGFALKLLVSEDEEPLDVVMFDNLCITRPVSCVCDIPNCDVYSTDPEAGTVSSQCSADPITVTTGTQAKPGGGTEAFIDVDWGTTSAHSSANIGVDTGIEADFSEECKTVSSVSVCVRMRADSEITGSCLGTVGSCRLANIGVIVKQDGEYYLTNTGTASLNRGDSVVRTITITRNVFRITSLPSSPISGAAVPCYPNVADTIDLNAPFEIVLFGGVNASVSTTSGIEYVESTRIAYDNICVKAVYNEVCRQSGSVALDLAGLSLIDNGCNDPAAATYLNGVLSSTIVLNWNSAYSNASRCGYVYLSPVFNSGSLFLGTRCTWWISVFLTVFTNGTSYLQIRTTVYDAICTGNINVIYAGTYSGFCEGGSLTPSTSGYEGSNLCPCVSVSGFSGSSATWEPL